MTIALDALRSASPEADSDERIPISLSSEAPVERFWGREILDHSAEAIDLSRAEGGLPLLLNHDRDKQIGVIEEVEVGSDRRLHGKMRFSRSTFAQEIRQDVLDGIRTRASIGYGIDELQEEADDTFRATRWGLYEGSIVSIPADPSVGVGRSSDEGTLHPVRTHSPAPTQPAPEAREHSMSEQDKAPTGAEKIVQVKDTRADELAAIAKDYNAGDRLVRWITENTSASDALRELAKERLSAEPKAVTPPAPKVEDYEREGKTFSLSRAIQAARTGDWSKAGFEREVSETEAKRLGRSVSGNTFHMPTMRKLSQREIETRAAQKVGTATSGGNLVFTEYGGFIDLLRNRSVVMRLGATVLPGLVGNVAFPRQTSATTAYWMAENSGTDVTESNTAYDQVSLSPKTLMARSRYTNQLLAQGVLNIDAMLQADIAQVLALEIDRAALHGTGASNQPQGIYGATGVNSVTFGGAISHLLVTKMIEANAVDNAPLESLAFVTTPEIMQDAMTTQVFSGTDGAALWQGPALEGSMVGIKAVASNQVSKTLGAATDHGLILGSWPELLIGEWGSVAITVDPYTLAGQDEVRIIARQFVDIDVRHGESFCTAATLAKTA